MATDGGAGCAGGEEGRIEAGGVKRTIPDYLWRCCAGSIETDPIDAYRLDLQMLRGKSDKVELLSVPFVLHFIESRSWQPTARNVKNGKQNLP